MQKKIVLVALLTVILGGVSIYGLTRPRTAAVPLSATSTTAAVNSGAAPGFDTAPAPLPLPKGTIAVVQSESTSSTHATPATSKESIALTVGTSTYQAPLTASHIVIDAMRALADRDQSFTFDGQEYSGLGFFVQSINGVAAAHGYNWMLYVNGTQSETGASMTKVKLGDRVEWKYEK